MREFRKVHQFNVFSVNSFIQFALADHLLKPESYTYLPKFFEKKRDLLQDMLRPSSLKPISCEGTYFQLMDYSSISQKDDLSFCKDLTMQHGVAAVNGLAPDTQSVMSGDERRLQELVLCVLDSNGKDASKLFEEHVERIGAEQAMAILMVIGRYVVHGLIVNTLALEPPVPSIFDDGFAG